jgi:DNA-binding beta-propeller fold protein YncE
MGGGRLFVAALGSNAVETINIGGRVLDHTISDVPIPQGIAFSPETNKLFVASGRGKVHIYDGRSYDQIAAIDFVGGADNLRYDAVTRRVYVGCGDDEKTGAIATIDAATNQRLNEEYRVGG